MEVLIIEERKAVAEKIKELLTGMDNSIRIVGISGNMETVASWLDHNAIPDLFLASDGLVEQAVSRLTNPVKATVILSTQIEEFRFFAFRYNTIRQLIQFEGKNIFPDNPASYPLPSASTPKERFLVKQGQKLLSIHVDQIAYFYSEGRFIFFRTFDRQKFLSEYRMEELEQVLPRFRFFRVNRSFLVALDSVKEIHAYFGNRLKLYLQPAPGTEVLVSRKRVPSFKQWLGK